MHTHLMFKEKAGLRRSLQVAHSVFSRRVTVFFTVFLGVICLLGFCALLQTPPLYTPEDGNPTPLSEQLLVPPFFQQFCMTGTSAELVQNLPIPRLTCQMLRPNPWVTPDLL